MTGTIDTSEKSTTQAARRKARALTVLAATVGGVVVWGIATLVGVALQVQQAGVVSSVGVGMVIAAGLVTSLLGWAFLAVLERFTRRAATVWTVVAAVLTVLSLAGPIMQATTTGTAIALGLMHLVVGAIAIVGFRRR